VQNITKQSLPKDVSFVPETIIEFLHQETNEKVPGIIKSVENDYIVVDFNHPLAGKDLMIKIKRLEAL
jgi:FKBP-type peptidyl-prolyl cis-trans isomerase SlpA